MLKSLSPEEEAEGQGSASEVEWESDISSPENGTKDREPGCLR